MQRQRRNERSKMHNFENCPPHQEKFSHGTGDDDLMTTALPLDSPHISMNREPSCEVLSHERTVMYPSMNDQAGPNKFDSINSAESALANRKNAGHK
jgi:hypothetical protein